MWYSKTSNATTPAMAHKLWELLLLISARQNTSQNLKDSFYLYRYLKQDYKRNCWCDMMTLSVAAPSHTGHTHGIAVGFRTPPGQPLSD